MPRIIRRYFKNRKLYDLESSSYVTLTDICDMIDKGEDVVVEELVRGKIKDVTSLVLCRIMVSRQDKGFNLSRQLVDFLSRKQAQPIRRY